MKLAVFFLIAVASLKAQQPGNGNKKIVCYYTNWSSYRPDDTVFTPKSISPFLCTHIIYSFTAFDKENDGMKPFDEFQDITRNGYNDFSDLKIYNENLKTLAAIGGWKEGSATFSSIAASRERRLNFAQNSIQFLRKYKFDGINIDWQFPGFREGGRPEDFENFVTLVKVLKEAYDAEPNVTADARLILTMSVPANTEFVEKGFDLPNLQLYTEFITILCYDYHYSTDPFINHHSPIYPLIDEVGDHPNSHLNMDWTVNYILQNGVPREKLVLGIPAFGRTYILEDETMNDIGAPSEDQGEPGKATMEIGYKAYYEICSDVINENWTVVHKNKSAMGPYAYKGKDWVSYDDPESAKLKGQYARDQRLGGIMFWAIDDDDFKGKCGGKGNPLIKAAREGFFTPSQKEVTVPTPTATPTRTPIPTIRTSTDRSPPPVEVTRVTESTMRQTRPTLPPPLQADVPRVSTETISTDNQQNPAFTIVRTRKDGEGTFLQNISVWIVNNVFHLGMKSEEGLDIDISF